jgi:hypothetical protein
VLECFWVMERSGSFFCRMPAAWLTFGLALFGCYPSEECGLCREPGIAIVDVSPGLSSPVVSVVVTPPCSTGDGHIDGSFTMYSSIYDGGAAWLTIHVSGSDPVTCNVYATLADGTELEAAVSFERVTGCCAGIVHSGESVLRPRTTPDAEAD